MKLVQRAIAFPVTTTVGVLLLALFGLVALSRIPVQLTPTVEEPRIAVQTTWPGASPLEVEREIVDEQEKQLQSLAGLIRMESTSAPSIATIDLTFQTGTDIDTALVKVSNRLQQVPQYPPDADLPLLTSVGSQAQPIAWFTLQPAGPRPFAGEVGSLHDFVEDDIISVIARVPGVAAAQSFGGQEREAHVVVEPASLASRQVTLAELVAALDRENRDVSAGTFDEGKRRYTVRTVAAYDSLAAIEDVVVATRGGVPIYVRDVASVALGWRRADARGYLRGEPMLALSITRQAGANVLDVMDGIGVEVARLNEGILGDRGLELSATYQETEYIDSAMTLVRQSLVVGGLLAIGVLLLFLRSPSSTLVVAVAIPISVIGSFLMMLWLGRSLNVISLAGLAFAVGMVVDNAIVVLENIYRHRQEGKSRQVAAYEGAREVWGAVLASTLTTVAVFVPILFVREEAGQLFRDIAIAISCAVALSLVVAMTVIPSLSARILDATGAVDRGESPRRFRRARGLWGRVALARRAAALIVRMVAAVCVSVPRQLATIVGLVALALGASWALMPKVEYLPVGNPNFIFGSVIPPPGYNLDATLDLQTPYNETFGPLWRGSQASRTDQPGGGVSHFFFVALPDIAFVAARAEDPLRVRELLPVFGSVSSKLDGALAFERPMGLFARGLQDNRSIAVDLSAPSLEQLRAAAREVYGGARALFPTAQVQVLPALDLGRPEVQLRPKRRQAAELGLSGRDLGLAVSALVDGVKASEYRHEGREIDLRVLAAPSFAHRTHLLAQMPIATPAGRQVTLGDVAEVVTTSGPIQLRHIDRQRAITVAVSPPETVPLQQSIESLQSDLLAPLRAAGTLDGVQVQLTGTADKLTQTARALAFNLILAVIITYLLMAALFESFLYPLIILFSVPLAALGGLLGLAVLNALGSFQALDVLTMLGFVILIGTVVNNAILIVYQALGHLRGGAAPPTAVRRAVEQRIRPIFMSVATSVFGMLPLVLFPGAGSELYRGLGSVVVGGLVVSTVFTLFLIPALLCLALTARAGAGRVLRGSA